MIPCLRSPSTAALTASRTFSVDLHLLGLCDLLQARVTSSCPILLNRKIAHRLWIGSMRFEE